MNDTATILTAETPRNGEAQRLFGPANYYAGPSLSGITLKDIRDAVLKMPHVPKIEYVRVSDAWWVCLEDGKPISSSPHNDLMKAIEEVSRHNGEVSHSEPERKL